MAVQPGVVGGMAYLPQWLVETKDPVALETGLASWCQAFGGKKAGLMWPAITNPTVCLTTNSTGVAEACLPPPEWNELHRTLATSSGTVNWQLPGTCGRLYAAIQPAGRTSGLLWIERSGSEPWSDADRQFLQLSAKLIERAPAFLAKLGPYIDPDRLHQRLGDAAIIAGRMAHDFDNVLTGIIGFSDLTMPLVPANSVPAKYIQQISDSGKRGTVFTQQLHQLSRAAQPKPMPGSIAQALAKEESRLRPQFPVGLQLAEQVSSDLGPVGMETGALGAVLGHILENAVEASGPNGRIEIKARAVELTPVEAKAYLGFVRPGGQVEVTIQDHGTGMKPEVRAKLFAEPFFTTKVRHRGLGLAIVYRALYAHGGGIRIESLPAPQTGTVVRLIFPPGAVRPPVFSAPRSTSAKLLGDSA